MDNRQLEIFFSYAHEDEELRNKLEAHLSMLKRSGLIKGWHDRKITPGKKWEREIDEHLNTADIIVLLISADFLNSDYCYGAEMTIALRRYEAEEACVIPIILRKVDYWEEAPFGKIQALPKDAVPVTSWSNLDEALSDVARGIRKAVEELIEALKQKEDKIDQHNFFQGQKQMIKIKEATFTVGSNKITVNEKKAMSMAPYIKDDRTYVPLKTVAQALNISEENILWNAEDQSVVLVKGDRVVKVTVRSETMLINGVPFIMDVAPELISGEVTLPVRWVAQALGASVTFDATTLSVVFTILS